MNYVRWLMVTAVPFEFVLRAPIDETTNRSMITSALGLPTVHLILRGEWRQYAAFYVSQYVLCSGLLDLSTDAQYVANLVNVSVWL